MGTETNAAAPSSSMKSDALKTEESRQFSADTEIEDDKDIAREGDLVIVQERHDIVTHLTLQADGVIQNRYGRFLHSDVIGRKLGIRWDAAGRPGGVQGRSCRGFIYALRPNAALWTTAMHHRTQVVYPHDAAIISLYLELRPGSVIVEAGTGAGSASVFFARTVAPHGRVISYEFHKERATAAIRDFKSLGLSDVIYVVPECDVLQSGFHGLPRACADAVFLDLPSPYHVVNEAARVLRAEGVLCTFSPCIEQVQRTCSALRKCHMFHSVRTITAPVRTYDTRAYTEASPGFDALSHSTQPAIGRKRRRTQYDITREEDQIAMEQDTSDIEKSTVETDNQEQSVAAMQKHGFDGRVVAPPTLVRSRPYPDMKGHTSYLTFARRRRDSQKQQPASPAAPVIASSRCKTM